MFDSLARLLDVLIEDGAIVTVKPKEYQVHVARDKPWSKFWPEGVPRHIDYPEVPLSELLQNTAAKYPDNIVFKCQEDSLTYAQLDLAVSKLAAYLNEQGIRKGDTMLLFLPNCLEFVIGYYGILKVGATVSPANPLSV